MEDPHGWGIQCEGLWAERIKDGKLTGEVHSPVILTGFVPELLASVRMVASDLEIHGLGSCGKGHKEYVKNTLGGPHMLFTARLA
jgi:TldD protein